ncbi:sulfatase-like hydrolase/transferase [bacterium]|nr:sulfatase-like hydrolase/transferase [bacterium]
MKQLSVLAVFLICIQCSKPVAEEPKLLIIMSVDQMRSDYPQRMLKAAPDGGMNRLLTNAVYFEKARHWHAFSGTAQGHATLSTGSYPKHHGIINNDMYLKHFRKSVYCVEDTTVEIVGEHSGEVPPRSPQYLMRSSMGDQVKANHPNSRVYSIAMKDRAAILLGGKNCNMAFWLDKSSGNFVSSNYYSEEFPNTNKWKMDSVKNSALKKEWNPDERTLKAGLRDTSPHERDYFSDQWPHNMEDVQYKEDNKPGYYLINTPFGDAYTLEMAKSMIEYYELGMKGNLDVLNIGLSASDYIGHHFGPGSQEVFDYYLKLDSYLENFTEYLDQTLGRDKYILVLSSDHGVTEIPEHVGSKRISPEQYQSDLLEIGKSIFGTGFTKSDIAYTNAAEIHFSRIFKDSISQSLDSLLIRFKTEVEALDYVEKAYVSKEVATANDSDRFLSFLEHSFREDLWADIVFIPKEGILINKSIKGTTHYTPYPYDTEVPLIIYYSGFEAQKVEERVNTVDLAPTILEYLRLDSISPVDGRSLSDLLEANRTSPFVH